MSIKFLNLKDLPVPENAREIYEKLRPFDHGGCPIKKVEFDKCHRFAYIWHDYPKVICDDYDKKFITNRDEFINLGDIYCYSNHSYHPLIIRHILMDVIKSGVANDIFDNIDDYEMIYVNSFTCDSNGEHNTHVYRCHNDEFGHLTRTVCYAKKKVVVKQEPAQKDIDDVAPKKRLRRSTRLAKKKKD